MRTDVTIGAGDGGEVRTAVMAALDPVVDGYTIRDGQGRWQGVHERSFTASLVWMDAWQIGPFYMAAATAAFDCGESAVLVETYGAKYGAVLIHRDWTVERIG